MPACAPRFRLVHLQAALAVLCLVSCGQTTGNGENGGAGDAGSTGSGGTSGSGGALSAAEMCERLPLARADYNARCYGGAPEDWLNVVEVPCGATARSENAGRISLDTDKAHACLAFLATDDCIFDVSKEYPCSSLVTGTVAEDEPCAYLGLGDECGPGTLCGYGDGCEGRCRAYGEEGTNCHGNLVTVTCSPGLKCDGPSAACLVPGGAGEPCAGDGLCEDGYYCDRSGSEQGTCVLAKKEGPCLEHGECTPGFRCIRDEAGATHCVRPKASGEPCRFGLRECQQSCSREGICQVAAHENEPCGSLTDSETLTSETLSESMRCAAGLFCSRETATDSEGVCRPQISVGMACPETWISSPCLQQGDEFTHCSDADQCVSCE